MPHWREVAPLTLAALVCSVLLIPLGYRTLGFFMGFGRYLLFLPVLIGLWTLCPIMKWLDARFGWWANGCVLVALSATLAYYAYDNGRHDRFAPLPFVRWAAAHPGNRALCFTNVRAGSVVDSLAGPHDVIAFDGGVTDSWIYPAFGEHLSRKVVLLSDHATPVTIPPEATWVVIDRAWSIIWERADFYDMGQFWRCINRGAPLPMDLRVGRTLASDPGWRLVYYHPGLNQAVFQRVVKPGGVL
jgi:hypothetical protein